MDCMNIILTLVFVLLALLSGFTTGYIYSLSKSRVALNNIREECNQWRAQAHEAKGRAQVLEMSKQELNEALGRDNHTARLFEPIAARLADMSEKVSALESHQTRQDAELGQKLTSFSTLSHNLVQETASLRAALTSSSARGTWGEIELRRIVEAAGMIPHVDFSMQETLAKTTQNSTSPSASFSRPDLTIHLPGGAHIAVDAKVPLAALLKAEAIQENDPLSKKLREDHLSDHAKALRQHINDLSRRDYPSEFPGSPQVTVMFLPNESLLSRALTLNPDLLDYALTRGIALTTPTSLLALLRSVAVIWSNSRITEEAQEILLLGKTLTSRLQTVAEHLQDLGNALKRTVNSYNKTISSLEKRVLVSVRKFDALDSCPSTLSQLDPDSTQIKEITAGELTSDKPDEVSHDES